MAWTPPVIVGTEFLDVENTDHKPPSTNSVARAAYDLVKFVSFNWTVAKTLELHLEQGSAKCTTSFNTKDHGDLGATSTDRLKYKVGKEPLKIKWKFQEHALIEHAVLEIFRKGEAQAVWTKEFTWDAGSCPEAGWTAIDLRLNNATAQEGAAPKDTQVTVHYTQEQFPEARLDEHRSPYKVKLTIRPGSYRRVPVECFAYFDIEPRKWLTIQCLDDETSKAFDKVVLKITPKDTKVFESPPVLHGAYTYRDYQPDGDWSLDEVRTTRDEPAFYEVVSLVKL